VLTLPRGEPPQGDGSGAPIHEGSEHSV
jgi:hypothetical protein